MHSLRISFREKYIPLDCQLEIIDKTIEPILTYGAEIWGYENVSLITQFQVQYLKNVLKIRQSTPNYMVFGETGKIPISVKIKMKMINFWKRLVTGKTDKISFQVYRTILNDYVTNDSNNYRWLKKIEEILIETGNYNVWLDQFISDSKSRDIEQVLKDQAFQQLNANMSTSNKGRCYETIKNTWGVLPNIFNIKEDNLISLIKYRTSNHRLPVEVGRYNDTPYNERSCPFCEDSLGDEYHYIMVCRRFRKQRKLYIENKYIEKPNMYKYLQLMNSSDYIALNKIGKFSAFIIKTFRNL